MTNKEKKRNKKRAKILFLFSFLVSFAIWIVISHAEENANVLQINSIPLKTIEKEVQLEKSEKKFSGSLKSELGIKNKDEEIRDDKQAYIQIQTRWQYMFSPFLYGKAEMLFNFRTGVNQEIYDASPEESRFYMEEAVVVFDPIPFFKIKPNFKLEFMAPIINQGFLEAPLLVSTQTGFLGLLERMDFNYKNFNFQLIAQQSIPKAESRNTQRTEREETPWFFVHALKTQSKWEDLIDTNISLSHYRYYNLPSIVAKKSSYLGNATEGGTNPGASFFYTSNKTNFQGLIFDANLCHCTSVLDMRGGYQFMMNFLSPGETPEIKSEPTTPFLFWRLAKSNQSGRFYLNAKLRFWNVSLEPSYEYYLSGRDVSPAIYADTIYGSANRKGSLLELALRFEDWGFALRGKYIQSSVVIPVFHQRDINEFRLSLESKKFTF